MSDPEAQPFDSEAEGPAAWYRRRRWRVLAALAIVLAAALTVVWLVRERIANSIIAGQIEDLGIPASYEIESIGVSRQVLRNVVVGDPRRPDLVIPRAVLVFEARLGVPVLGRARLEGMRLYGRYGDRGLSFGELDRVLRRPGTGAGGLPDLDLELVDARARIDSRYGAIGVKATGEGNLRRDFEGRIAAIAPRFTLPGCAATRASLYGELTTASARPQFSGPVRLSALDCPEQHLTLRDLSLRLDAQVGERLDRVRGDYALRGGALAWQGARARQVEAQGVFAWAEGDFAGDYELAATAVDLGTATAAELTIEGTARSRDRMAALDGEGRIEASELRSGRELGAALARLERAGEGSLAAPLLRQLREALDRQLPGSQLGLDYQVRRSGTLTQLTIPAGALDGRSGERLIELDRVALTLGMAGGPRFSGQFVTGGPGLPQLVGEARREGGAMLARVRLAEYRAGTSAIALPELRLVQLAGGQIGFAGRALVSGPLPFGSVRNLAVPLDGNWSARAGLAMGRRCLPVTFDMLTVGSLRLARRGLTLCPARGGAIVRSDGAGTRIAAGTPGINLAGAIGGTPVRLRSGAIGAAWPGALTARNLDISMGPVDRPGTIRVASFTGRMGPVITGRFSGTEARLFAVPLDVTEANGALRFANSVLELSDASLKVSDREQPARFYPVVGRDATLRLADGVITAQALLREPRSDRPVVATDIVHTLATSTGHADLTVPGIVFDQQLQPDTLTYFASGVIALAKGTVTGDGRIDWNAEQVTSTGAFSSTGLDFAAAFGPVKGVRGTVRFSDLLGMVTEPDQRVTIASINPGIEVYDGTLSFQLEPDRRLVVNGADWPFIDGRLKLLPTRMVLGNAETRRFTLKLEGANAAKFVQRLDLANISATGIFDGTLPLVFDEEGGRVDNGLLISRPPGGNLSYVGELTYKDLSLMGNFAFQTLRSLDFRRMEIGLSGRIDGEIVTNLRMEGVRQGPGAKRNFLTRQLANLPIRFNVNIRAPFYQLITSFKSLYDPAYIRDPRSLGLIDEAGNPAPRAEEPRPAPSDPPTPGK